MNEVEETLTLLFVRFEALLLTLVEKEIIDIDSYENKFETIVNEAIAYYENEGQDER